MNEKIKLFERIERINELRCELLDIQDQLDNLMFNGLTPEEQTELWNDVYGDERGRYWI